jgi:hypothetical protein
VSVLIAEEALRARLAEGGKVFGAFIVAKDLTDITVHLSCNWLREPGCRTAMVTRGAPSAGDFSGLDEAWAFIREMGYAGVIPIYPNSAYEPQGSAQELSKSATPHSDAAHSANAANPGPNVSSGHDTGQRPQPARVHEIEPASA